MGLRSGRSLSGIFATILCAVAVGAAPAVAQDAGPVLGSSTYAMGGGGWGTAQPDALSNGGAPSGTLTAIRWRNWGEPVAKGVARASLYKPGGTYYGQSGKALLRAKGLASCPGDSRPAYTVLEVRLPSWPGGPPGPWFKWSGSMTVCDSDERDPRYENSRWPGNCGYTGTQYGLVGQARDIMSVRVGCARARRVAQRSRRLVSPSPLSGPRRRCGDTGCRVRIRGFRCTFRKVLYEADNDPVPTGGIVQRVACRRADATITWFYSRYRLDGPGQ